MTRVTGAYSGGEAYSIKYKINYDNQSYTLRGVNNVCINGYNGAINCRTQWSG